MLKKDVKKKKTVDDFVDDAFNQPVSVRKKFTPIEKRICKPVEPIRELKDIETIKKLLSDHPRNNCILVLGINTNLRASDLCRMKVAMVRNIKAGESFTINEKKTGKPRRITMNIACEESIQRLLASRKYDDEDMLFQGKKGALTPRTLYYLVKAQCKNIKLRGNYGSNTLRIIWGYHQRVTFGTDIPTLMQCFNHSTQKQTLDYLGVQPEEIKKVYENIL